MIALARTDDEVNACFAVMRELRPHVPAADFVPRVRSMAREGYELVYVEEDGQIRAVAGFRIMHLLCCGRILYVDDLVTRESDRSKGWGRALLEWLKGRAREAGCAELHLDSGVQRTDAHRFYRDNALEVSSYHFRIRLGAPASAAERPERQDVRGDAQ